MYQIDFHKPLHIHFIGIGGISMSGLAEILLEENFIISGSDSKSSPLTQALEKKGATIYYGQRASNISDQVELVVYTAAVHPDNSLPTYSMAGMHRGLSYQNTAPGKWYPSNRYNSSGYMPEYSVPVVPRSVP